MSKNRVLIICEYFYPGYLAGGPIQSLVNLVQYLGAEHEWYILTSAYDLQSTEPYTDLALNDWNEVQIGNTTCKVWYSTQFNWTTHRQVLKEAAPHWVYINGMYQPRMLALALMVRAVVRPQAHYLIAPRGMFQRGAMATRKRFKQIYLRALKSMGLFRNLIWHATDVHELVDIQTQMSKKAVIRVADNIPKQPLTEPAPSNKPAQMIRLVYLSIISEKKNLLGLLQAILHCRESIQLDIYGPVKDAAYWESCRSVMATLPKHISVQYKGDVLPDQVQSTIAQYDALVLLTKGENFGHALFESLSVGRPIITSWYTPWKGLESIQAGWNLDIQNSTSISTLIDDLAKMPPEEWSIWCKGAWKKAKSYFYEERNFQQAYKELFQ